jgi:hypothetical protein
LAFKLFFWKSLGIAFALAALVAAGNMYRDEFGLFRSVKGRQIDIPVSERATKYLLSFRYIPVNFEGILIGPSLSDQLDTKQLRSLKTYNLSLLGANGNELRLLAENVLRRGNMKAIIVCIDPFITRESGINDQRMQPHMYWSALGSTFMFKHYVDQMKEHFKPRSGGFRYNDYGAANIHSGSDPRQAITNFANLARKGSHAPIPVDPRAFAALQELFALARQKNVKIFAFYFPMPDEVFTALEPRYRDFQAKMNTLFTDRDTVWDFNADSYREFRRDYRNYSDQGHISSRGADFLLKEIDRRLAGNV